MNSLYSYRKPNQTKILVLLAFFLFPAISFSATFYTRLSGNWNVAATWSTVSCAGGAAATTPGAGDDVIVCAGKTLSINVASACNSLTINSTGIAQFTAAVTCAVTGALNVSGTITGSQTGTFTAASMSIPSGQIANIDRSNITISGTLSVSGSYSIDNTVGTKIFANVSLNLGGDWTATVNNPIISITGNFTMSDGSIIRATGGNVAQYTVGGNFICNAAAGTSDIARCDLTIQGMTILNGEFRFAASGAGIKTFNGGITLNAGSQFDNTVGEDPFINGNIVNNGTWSDGSGGTCTYTFGNSGNYTISGNPMIMSTIKVLTGTTVTNLGAITVIRNNGLTGAGSFYNGNGSTNSYIEFRGGTAYNITFFDASSINNTVEYGSTANQGIQIPNLSKYYNLIVGGAGIKSMVAPLIVLNNVTISSTLQTNNNDMSVGGNWNDNGTFTVGTATITFNGSGNQSISAPFNASGETFRNLTAANTGTGLTLSSAVTITNTFAMNGGNIDAQTNTLTLGFSTANVGTLSRTAGTILGKFERWINATASAILFPVGTTSLYCPANITFTNLTSGSLITEFNASAPGNSGLPLVDAGVTLYNTFGEGYWVMTTANGLASTNFNNELTGNGFASFPITGPTRLLSRANSAGSWTANGTHVAAVNPTTKRSAMTLISGEYTFGDTSNCTAPLATSAITGSTSVCKNQAGAIYSVTNTPGNTYTWTVTGGSITSGAGTSAITVTWGATGMAGSVAVYQNNGCSNSPSTSLAVSVNVLTTSVISGSVTIAASTTGVNYSVVSVAGYTYNWVVTGGTVASGAGTAAITVDWGSAGTGTLTCTATHACGSAAPVNLSVIIYPIITSIVSGNWNVAATWDCNCIPQITNSVRIDVGHTVTLVANTTIKHFVIRAGAIMDDATFTFTVTGDYTNNGTHTGTQAINLTGNSTIIDGSGIIANANALNITTFGKTVANTANLTKTNGNISIANGLTVTNNGAITIVGNLVGGNATASWINALNSTLNITGVLLTGAPSLNATANGNTVNYNGIGNQNIKQPSGSTYYNLIASNDATKSMASALTILGDLTITGTSQLNIFANANTITLSGDWLNSSTNADPFVQMNGVVTLNGTTNQLISNASGETFYNLTINKAAGAVNHAAATNITVTNSLTLTKGIIYTNGNMVIIPDNGLASAGNSTSFVDGMLKKIGNDVFVYPVGNNLLWARIAITAPANVTTEFTAQYFNIINPYTGVTAPLTDVSYLEHWILNRGVTTDSVTVKLYWENNVRSGINNNADLTVAKWNGTSWIDAGRTAISYAATGNVTSKYVTSFSPFTFGSKSLLATANPLPVELINFSATKEQNKVYLSWSTASELNNDYFEIERSTDAQEFYPVAKIKGAGTTSKLNQYYEYDTKPIEGTSYYRLKQVDFDGKTKTYSPVKVEFNETGTKTTAIKAFPNPSDFGTTTNVALSGFEPETNVLVVLRDINGREVYTKVVVTDVNGETFSALDVEQSLPVGIYIVIATSNDQLINHKLIIK